MTLQLSGFFTDFFQAFGGIEESHEA
jgi:hypothetical protein